VQSGGLREQVIAAGRWAAAGQQRLVHLCAALESSGEWAFDGAATCAHWIADALDVEVCTAREWLRIGRALDELPLVDDAFTNGRLSYSKVRALTRVVTPEHEKELCAVAERTPAGRLPTALAAWLVGREAPGETERRQARARSLHWWVEPDGMIVGRFRLPAAAGAGFAAAVDAVVMRQSPVPTATERGADASADAPVPPRVAEWPTIAQQRADALMEVVEGGGVNIETEVVLHVRGDGCTLDDGTPIASSVVERIAPASFLRVLLHDAEARPINASGRRRHPTRRQKRVVHERDRGCVDCGATEFTEFDHEPPYEETRQTIVEEVHERCWSCHRARQAEDARKPSKRRSRDRPASDAA
jgi:hypothetical protein